MSKKSKNFVIGAAVIAVANLLIKIIGAGFKFPLDWFILHDVGIGIYSTSYSIYNWLFVISTAGIPVAISKMVAEAQALGKFDESKRIFMISRNLLFFVGLCSSCVLFFFADEFANLLGAPSTYLTMRVMAPSLFFVAMSSSYRGFYQGQQNMFPTAISEVMEALSKLIFGLSLAYFLSNLYNQVYITAAGAIAGVTIGTFISLIYLLIYHFVNIKKIPKDILENKVTPARTILAKIIKIAFPITIGVSVFTLTSVLDTATVTRLLRNLSYTETESLSMYGSLNRAITMFNFPPTIISAIAISIVPTIAAALALKNKSLATNNAKAAIRIVLLIGVPCAVGLSALAQPIMLLFRDTRYFLLTIMGIAVIFVTLVQVCNAILQSWGKVWIPVTNMAIGGLVKIGVNILLVSRPEININGAPIGTLSCYITVMLLNIISIKKNTGMKFEFADFILKPIITGIVTYCCAFISYYLLYALLGNFIALIAGVAAGGISYLLSLVLVKGIKKEDVLLLPKGDRIVEKLSKFGVIS